MYGLANLLPKLNIQDVDMETDDIHDQLNTSFHKLNLQNEPIELNELYNLNDLFDASNLPDDYIDPADLYNLDQSIDLSDLFEMNGGQIDFYNLKSTKNKRNEEFKCDETICTLEMNDPRLNNFLEAGNLYQDLFTKIHDEFVRPIPETSKMRFCIYHDDFSDPINSAFMDKKDLTVKMMFDTLERVVQSKKNTPLFEISSKKNMKIYIFSADNPIGKGNNFFSHKMYSKSVFLSVFFIREETFRQTKQINRYTTYPELFNK